MHSSSDHHLAFAVLHQLLGERRALSFAASRLAPAPFERKWAKISEDVRHDAWLIAWGGYSELAAHDHGDSHAVVGLVRGSLVEWYRDPGDRATWNVREIDARSSIHVPPTRVHELHNPTEQTAYSVHVYAPPLTVMNPHAAVAELSGIRA